jgi:ankyrin repeat protein
MKKIVSFFCLLSGIVWLAGFAFGGEIHDAAKRGNIAKINSLLHQDLNLLSEKDETGRTPMHWAAGRGRTALLSLFLDIYHADVDVLSDKGETPLHLAASQGYPECVKILLEHRAYVNARSNNNSTALHFAAWNGRKPGHLQAAKILLDYGVDMNAETDSGTTALDMALYRHNTEIVELLNNYRAKTGSSRRSQRTTSPEPEPETTDDQGAQP